MKYSQSSKSTMRALAVSPEAPGRIDIQDVPTPSARPDEVLVEVHAISLNRGEMRALRSAPAGVIPPGWDFAGVLLEDISDELTAGSRVLGIVEHGAWAEMVAVRRDSIAAIPEEITFAQAAALPTAGLTALRTLRLGAVGLGDHVLVTGAPAVLASSLFNSQHKQEPWLRRWSPRARTPMRSWPSAPNT